MTSTSDGSQRDPQEFLTQYAEGVEDAIRKLQSYRVPTPGESALTGAEPQNTAANLAGRV